MNKKHNKGRTFTVRMGQIPTKERRRQHGGVIAEIIDQDGNGKTFMRRYRAAWECPLDAYLDHKTIGPAEHQAGINFRRAYFNAVLSKRAAYIRRSHNIPFKDVRPTSSEKLLKEAYRKVSPHYIGAIIDICGLDQPARDRGKLDRLQKGLKQLAVLWNAAAIEVFDRH